MADLIGLPPGWHRNGDGKTRYFDGTTWAPEHDPGPAEGRPAGWYNNDDGRLRWWDGEAWRENFDTTGGGQHATPPPANPAPLPASAKSGVKWGRILALAAVISVAVWACSGSNNTKTDPSADHACVEWTEVVVEGGKGVMTDAEITGKVHDIYLDSLGNEVLEGPATALQRGVVNGTVDASDARRMTAACNEWTS